MTRPSNTFPARAAWIDCQGNGSTDIPISDQAAWDAFVDHYRDIQEYCLHHEQHCPGYWLTLRRGLDDLLVDGATVRPSTIYKIGGGTA